MLKYATFALLFLLILLQSNIVLADGRFSGSCANIGIEKGRILEAYCRKNNGGYTQTSINLNNYIANDEGKLVWRRNGRYIATSKNCILTSQHGISFLRCNTRRENGNWKLSTLNLDRRIANINGQLKYRHR
ncbi:CVNH domain-containing protein [Nostocaceae cyanobacterium CENA369]|uniref:CVNH domain-containing protein n=1 Tax=Dendronalium phyllosphericum CENA369 TaxID=1725256 RepID=A0A8J7IBP1_9NOST|nr:CVNH domain-containing protein [Dendronalium phyllosphericum]MBH8577428.1 CVNH domain-containing protein [Dendronalium phyllosphericum CENA369]